MSARIWKKKYVLLVGSEWSSGGRLVSPLMTYPDALKQARALKQFFGANGWFASNGHGHEDPVEFTLFNDDTEEENELRV